MNVSTALPTSKVKYHYTLVFIKICKYADTMHRKEWIFIHCE